MKQRLLKGRKHRKAVKQYREIEGAWRVSKSEPGHKTEPCCCQAKPVGEGGTVLAIPDGQGCDDHRHDREAVGNVKRAPCP